MAIEGLGSFFPPYHIGFLNQRWVQQDLGVPLNFSSSSTPVVTNFMTITSDPIRRTIQSLNYLLESGIRLALVFGDRDYRCNCMFYVYCTI
jgi:hypothetical protein